MRSIRHNLPLLCLFILSFSSLRAQQEISFANLTVENGLSQNSVMAIAQDSSGYIWLGTRQGLNRYDGYRFKIYKNFPGKKSSITPGEITAILTDNEGTLWVGTAMGLNRYDEKTDQFIQIKTLNSNNIETIYQDADKNIWIGTLKGLSLLTDKKRNIFKSFRFSTNLKDLSNYVYSIFRDKQGNLWIGTGNGLFCMNYRKGQYHYKKIPFTHKLPSNYITTITEDLKGNLWIGTTNGLCSYDFSKSKLKIFQHDNKNANSVIHNDIREIKVNEDGLIWIGTQDGLSILNSQNEHFLNHQHDPEIATTISHNSIHSIFRDRNRNMWIGTYFGGVNLFYPISTKFKIYRNSRRFPSISGNILSSVLEDDKHNLWIGTEGGGLNYYDRKRNSFKAYKTDPDDSLSITSNLVKIIKKESAKSEKLIIGTHRGGLNIFDPANGKFKQIKNIKDPTGAISLAEIVALQVDKRGTVWIGSQNGLTTLGKVNGQYPDKTSKSTLDKYIKNKSISAIFEDSQAFIWIGTSEGLYRYQPTSGKLKLFSKDEGNSNRLQSDYINCITENTKGEILIGTYFGGLSIYNPKTDVFKTFREQNGLVNNNVLGIIEDDSHNLWLSTVNGLSELNPATGRFRNYTKSDGLAGNEFNARSFFKDSNGEIFFGGINGLTYFYPKDIQLNRSVSPLLFSGLKLFNQPVEVNGTDNLLTEQINKVKTIEFNHDQNHFTIEFAVLNYIKSDKNRYAYKLESYEKDWNTTAIPSATYTNLPAGNYRFIVRGANNDGTPVGKNISINIHIKPAVWASWWAYIIYLLIFSIILFLTIRYLFIRALLKRTEDVQQMKLRFFTHISHEIRTPLTLILGPLESLAKSTTDLPNVNQQVLPIKANAERLLRLITELMDFRKTETGNLKLQVAKQDLISFTQEIFNAFNQLAESRKISYEFIHEKQSLEIYFDRLQLEKVFFNLLSNAFKFTSDTGKITLSIEEQSDVIHIRVRDNGIGIPEESKDKLFSDFFQVDSQGPAHIGSGIGLALSKAIVNAHEGNILIESKPHTPQQSGETCFTVVLKKGDELLNKFGVQTIQESGKENQIYNIPMATSDVYADQSDVKQNFREIIHIIEDNVEIRKMLRELIGSDYEILESENGQTGWELLSTKLPDLVICDVMMPIMNGLDLCRKLKTDERTAHIPIILLTARAAHPHQVHGLETGADVYITKPFSMELLLLNIKNLLQSRKIMRRKFSEQINLQPQDITINTVDHNFITKTILCIEKRMTDQDFSVQELSKEIGMSQPVLYKKIRAITDLSVNDFIKSIRLKKAAQLLEERVHNVSEVAYLVGFNDPKYFSREFKKQYGHTPKVYLNNLDALSG